jgi:hypothetical protein
MPVGALAAADRGAVSCGDIHSSTVFTHQLYSLINYAMPAGALAAADRGAGPYTRRTSGASITVNQYYCKPGCIAVRRNPRRPASLDPLPCRAAARV